VYRRGIIRSNIFRRGKRKGKWDGGGGEKLKKEEKPLVKSAPTRWEKLDLSLLWQWKEASLSTQSDLSKKRLGLRRGRKKKKRGRREKEGENAGGGGSLYQSALGLRRKSKWGRMELFLLKRENGTVKRNPKVNLRKEI